MKKTWIAALCTTLLAVPVSLKAEEIYKCGSGENIVFQSTPCPEHYKYGKKHLIAFDGWKYGMNIIAMKKIATKRQLAISPGSHLKTNKFNPSVLDSEPNARIYTYATKIGGQDTLAHLFFTPKTEKLYRIEANLLVSELPAEEREFFFQGLVKQLTQKYGQPTMVSSLPKGNSFNQFSTQSKSSENDQLWISKKQNYVTLGSYGISEQTFNLNYQHMTFSKQYRKENLKAIQSKTDKALSKDAVRL